ncbi:MAG: patatin-like phospholipase family protein [Alphaproteobacteria bacterium]|nr:patatin-like phospholipase family protein [Alphaproteobacteria bacterium]
MRISETFDKIRGALTPRQRTDFIFILRGGAGEIYTSIYNLFSLEKRVGHSLHEHRPYLIGDSAGAFVVAGLAAPSLSDPTKPALTASDLPQMFRDNIYFYLSRRRDKAKERLEETIGRARLCDSLLPVCISSCSISPTLSREYFQHVPEGHFLSAVSNLPNLNEAVQFSDAALASSAYPLRFGDHAIAETGKRYIDMAVLETHSSNLVELSDFYKTHLRSRRLVCVIFGNNYENITLRPTERLGIFGMNRHFPEALRALVHMDMVEHTTKLFGKDNVFDLSLRLDQPFAEGKISPFPDAFTGYASVIQKRMSLTEQLIANNPEHQQKLDCLAEIIRNAPLPHHRPSPNNQATFVATPVRAAQAV